MKTRLVLFLLVLTPLGSNSFGQTEAGPPVWQVTGFDLNVNVQQPQRTLTCVATINATNVGGSAARTFTVRLNQKSTISSAAVSGAATTFRTGSETRGNLLKAEVSLPAAVAPGSSTTVTVTYALPVESNSGLAAISPSSTQFLPLSFWYPMPNTPFSTRGADTAPFHLTVNLPNAVSSGVEKASNGSATFDQPLSAQPFFVQGNWDKIEGAGESKGVSVLVAKGVSAEERKQGEAIAAYAGASRAFLTTLLGPASDVPLRIVSVERGGGFSDAGTILLDHAAFRRTKLDALNALNIAEGVARLWIGGQVPVRGEGNGVLHDGLVRFIATLILEKQFGTEAAEAERLRGRLAFIAVAKRDGPLSRAIQLDSTYFGSVPNKGAMVWRLVDHLMGHTEFMSLLKTTLEAARSDQKGFTLAGFRAALAERGGERLKTILDQQLDQVTDTDLLVGLPQQRGADWVSALRNLGSVDANVSVVGITDRGERVSATATIPARNFGEAVFKTPSRVVRVEVDPEKYYPQIDFSNDVIPRAKDLPDALAAASLQLGAQDFVKAEALAREMTSAAPLFQEAQIVLGRALLGQNKLEDAEKVFRSLLEQPLPLAVSLAWANIGLGEIGLKRGQSADAVKRFNDAVHASADYASSLAARAARIRAEAATNQAPPIDEAARAFIAQIGPAIVGGKKADLESKVVSGELVRFLNASFGTTAWETRVLRTEQIDADSMEADVSVRLNKLGKEGSGTAVFVLSQTAAGLRLAGIELFEVQ
jgi:tetratricopeptide (TPR) repeat protein